MFTIDFDRGRSNARFVDAQYGEEIIKGDEKGIEQNEEEKKYTEALFFVLVKELEQALAQERALYIFVFIFFN